jgi:hypothetical protein
LDIGRIEPIQPAPAEKTRDSRDTVIAAVTGLLDGLSQMPALPSSPHRTSSAMPNAHADAPNGIGQPGRLLPSLR